MTNKRYYYAGADGQSSVLAPRSKSGAVSLKDAYAITAGTMSLHGDYISLETPHETYKIWLGNGKNADDFKPHFDRALLLAQEQSAPMAQPVFSAAEELKKYKELLDMGAITQEEYDAKKKQLLDL